VNHSTLAPPHSSTKSSASGSNGSEHIPWNRQLGILGRVQPFENFFCLDTCDGTVGRGWGAWQIAARLSYANFNDDNIFGGIGKSATLALNWHLNSHARLQFNYIFGRIDDRMANLTNGDTVIASGDYQITGTRVIIDF
jgi:phosphate-selective porin OprO/OprP